MNIKRLALGQMQSNCYLVWDSQKNAIIIDPGDDADFIAQNINEQELTPQAILATHGHFDHVMAAFTLKLIYQIPFYMHKADEFILARMTESAQYFLNFDPGPSPEVDIYLKDKSILKIENYELKILHTPGHTPGSVCFYFEKERSMFTGDLIFAGGGLGRADFKYSDKRELVKSINKIKKMPNNTVIYPGHGAEFQLSSHT